MATTDPFETFREDAANKLASTNRELLDTVDISKELDKQFKNVSSNLRNAYNNTTGVRDALNSTLDLVSKLGREYVDADKITERIFENRTKLQTAEGAITTLYEAQINSYIAIGSTRAQAVALVGDEKRMYDEILARMESNYDYVRASVKAHEKEYVNLMQQVEGRKVINTLLEEAKDKVEGFNKIVGETTVKASALSKIFGSFSGIPFLKDFIEFKVLSDAFKKGTLAGFNELGNQLIQVFKSPLFWIAAIVVAVKKLVELVFEFDKQITDIANNLAMSKESSLSLMDSFRDVSNSSYKVANNLDNAFLSVKNQANALLELQDTLQTNVLFSNEMIQNQILLTKQMGLSKEEAAGIQKMSLLTGRSAEKILESAVKQNTTAVSYRKIIADISKINSEISVMYKNNPDLIAKAVIQANKLGLSMEQTQKISKSLLDFETSISGELESELLLGKQFNFEKARALALDGKSVEAASELMSQMGGLNSLTQLNVIQRERLAASIGMSAEELTNSAREQEVLNRLGFENKKSLEERYEVLRRNGDLVGLAKLQEEARKKEGGELLLQDIARANLQQRFQESVERIKQIFTEMAAGPLTKVLESLASFLSHTTFLKIVLASLVGITAIIATNMALATGGLSLLLGAVAGGITYAAMSSGPEETTGAKPGTSTQASLPTRNNNLPSYNNNQGGGGSSSINEETVKAIQELHNTVKQGAPVYLDTVRVGTTMTMNNHTK